MAETGLTRRTMLKIGAAAPLVAVPVATAAASVPIVAETAAAAAPTIAVPAWGWWAGIGGEGRFTLGPFLTRDEAVAAGRQDWDGATFDIIEAIPGKPSLRVDGDEILEMLDIHNEDHHDPEGDATIFPGTISHEATKELGDAVSAVIAAWVKRHDVEVRGYLFGRTRNAELIFESLADDPAPGRGGRGRGA